MTDQPGPEAPASAARRVIIFGLHAPDWMRTLAATAQVWNHVRGVGEVVLVSEKDMALLPAADRDTVIIPLMERHIAVCPRSYRSLFPDPADVQTLADKGTFSRFVSEQRLDALCPATYQASEARFPCVLKRVDLNAGRGIALVQSAAQLQALLSGEPWLGKPFVLQEFVPADFDYTTNAVLKYGRILWHRTYRYGINPDDPIQRPGNATTFAPADASDPTIAKLENFLAPLGYSGPVNFDYRFAPDGSLRVLEINPRLGGSLMRADNLIDLAEALSLIIANAE